MNTVMPGLCGVRGFACEDVLLFFHLLLEDADFLGLPADAM